MKRIMDGIKVELSNDGCCIGISTYDRNHGARGRFLILRETMLNAMCKPEDRFSLSSDCGSFAELWRNEYDLTVRITWLSDSYPDNIWGFRQEIRIPMHILMPLLTERGKVKFLYQPKPKHTVIISTPATATIQRILENKLTRRAFSKAMRDNFNWSDEVVSLYNDGGYSFYFTTKSGFPRNGGLILSHGTLKNGYPYMRYYVHT